VNTDPVFLTAIALAAWAGWRLYVRARKENR